MFDSRFRPWIDPPLKALAVVFVRRGVTAEAMTWGGLAAGLAGAILIGAGLTPGGLVLFVVNRVADGLDGPMARQTKVTDRGGYLDIVADFLIYGAYPLAFAVAEPDRNALAAAALLASVIASGTTFLAFAALAAQRGLTTTAQGAKSIYYLAGLAEGSETILVFVAMCLWPHAFAPLAWGFAALCGVSALARLISALRLLH